MRVCCGLSNHLELAQRPDLYGTPVVVGLWEEHVVAASEEALPFGVVPGMALRQAEHLCPQATFLTPDPEAASRLRELISSALYDLAPVVEVRVEGIAWLHVGGVVRAGESIREARRRLRTAIGREPRLGLAPGPFTARLAAARARPGRLMRVDDARSFLAPLSVHELPLDSEQLERLDLLGLRTLGAVAAIGPRELESQLGREGRHAVLLARGLEPGPLQPWRPPLFTSAHRQFEEPVEDREALLFVSRALCGDLAGELGLRGAGAKHVRVRLVLEPGDQEKREAVVRHSLSSAAELFGLIGSWIKEWQPRAPIAELWIELPVLEGAGRRQLRLWAGGDGNNEEVLAALERLQERHGDGMVRKPRPALISSPIPSQRFALCDRSSAHVQNPAGSTASAVARSLNVATFRRPFA
jgi:nucleotidyltransferase/DNA polymerase involved in DNA repair